MTSRSGLGPTLHSLLAGWLLCTGCATPSHEAATAPPPPGSTEFGQPELEPGPVEIEHLRLELKLEASGELSGSARLRLLATSRCTRFPLALAASMEVLSLTDAQGELGWVRARAGEPGTRAALWVDAREELSAGDALEIELRFRGRPMAGMWSVASAPGSEPSIWYALGGAGPQACWFPRSARPGDRCWFDLVLDRPASWVTAVAGARRLPPAPPPAGATAPTGSVREEWRFAELCAPDELIFVCGELRERRLEDAPAPAGAACLRLLTTPDAELDADGCEPDWFEVSRAVARRMGVPAAEATLAFLPGLPDAGAAAVWSGAGLALLPQDWMSDPDGERVARALARAAVRERLPAWAREQPSSAPTPQSWWKEGLIEWLAIDARQPATGSERRAAFARCRTSFLAPPTTISLLSPDARAGRARLAAGGACLLESLAAQAPADSLRRALGIALSRSRPEFLTDLERGTGLQLADWLAPWQAADGPPLLHLRWSDDAGRARVLVTATQHHDVRDGGRAAFEYRLPVTLGFEGGESEASLGLARRRELIEIARPGAPLYLRLSASATLPVRLELEQDQAAWTALLRQCPDEGARVEALAQLTLPPAREAQAPALPEELLEEVRTTLASASSSLVERAACVSWIASGSTREARALLGELALEQPRRELRLAALVGLQRQLALRRRLGEQGQADRELRELGARLFESSSDSEERAAAAALVAVADPERAWDFVRAALNEESPGDRLRAFLMRLVARLDHPEARAALLRIATRQDASLAVRAAALRALDPALPESRRLWLEMSASSCVALRAAALEALAGPSADVDRSVLRGLQGLAPGG